MDPNNEAPIDTLRRAVSSRLNNKGFVRLNTRNEVMREVRSPTFGCKLRPIAQDGSGLRQTPKGSIDLGTSPTPSAAPVAHTLFPVMVVERYLAERRGASTPPPLIPSETLRKAIRSGPPGIFHIPTEVAEYRGTDHQSPSLRSRILHFNDSAQDDLTQAAMIGLDGNSDVAPQQDVHSASANNRPFGVSSLTAALLSLRSMVYKTARSASVKDMSSSALLGEMSVLTTSLVIDDSGPSEVLIVKRNALAALRSKAMGMKRRLPHDGPEKQLWCLVLSECVDAAEVVSRALQRSMISPSVHRPAPHPVPQLAQEDPRQETEFGTKLDGMIKGFAERAASQLAGHASQLLSPSPKRRSQSSSSPSRTRPAPIPIGMPPLYFSRRRKQHTLMDALRFGEKKS